MSQPTVGFITLAACRDEHVIAVLDVCRHGAGIRNGGLLGNKADRLDKLPVVRDAQRVADRLVERGRCLAHRLGVCGKRRIVD